MYDGDVTLKNSILVNNYEGSATTTGNDYYYNTASSGTATDNGYNIIEFSNVAANASQGMNNVNDILYNTVYNSSNTSNTSWNRNGSSLVNQNLNISSTLADNGGPTQTLALSSGSFAIDAGTASGTSVKDQRGAYRKGSTDIGAFEYDGVFTVEWHGSSDQYWNNTGN